MMQCCNITVRIEKESVLTKCDTVCVEIVILQCGCSGLVVAYRNCNREVAGSTHTRSMASNLEQVANLLCALANSASYPQQDGK